MHWLNLIVAALLYALVGSMIGITYAFITGATMLSFGSVVFYGVILGPVVLMVIAAMRKLMRESRGIPIARAIYHTVLLTFAAPVFLYAAQLIAVAASAPGMARVFEVLKYWSIPGVFVVAVLYGIWRVMEGNRPRATSASGGSGGAPPSGGGSTASADRREFNPSDSLPRDAQGYVLVPCFSSRGGPFRLIRRRPI